VLAAVPGLALVVACIATWADAHGAPGSVVPRFLSVAGTACALRILVFLSRGRGPRCPLTRASARLAVAVAALAFPVARAEGATSAACSPSPTRLCLLGGRFAATLSWDDGSGPKPALVAGPRADGATSASGLFRFYESDPSNWEVLVKVVDGCRTNGRFWVLVSASTGFGWRLEMVDQVTTLGRAWFHPLDGQASGIADFDAFRGCPSQGRPPSVRYRNDLACGPETFVSTLSATGGPTWQSTSGVPSPAQDVTADAIGPFVETNPSPCGGAAYAGSFPLSTDRRWLLLQTLDDATGDRVLKIFDEGSAWDPIPDATGAKRADGEDAAPPAAPAPVEVGEIEADSTAPGLRTIR